MMNKFFRFLTVFGISLSFTFAIETSYSINVDDFETNCTEANVDAHYYLDSNSKTVYPIDLMSNISKTVFIRNTETSVRIWKNGANDIMNCGDWYRVSNVLPSTSEAGGLSDIVVLGVDGCNLYKKKGVNPSLPDAQIVYKIAYKEELGKNTGQTSNYYYYRYQNGSYKEYKLADQTKRIWSDIKYTNNECFNIYIHYCGDGTVDSFNGEQCDDGNNTNGDGCDANCQLETPTCTVTANPASGNAPLTTTLDATTNSWASYTFIDFGDGNRSSNPSFPLTHTYYSGGNYAITVEVQNNISPIAPNVDRPVGSCSAVVQVSGTTPPGDQPKCGPANGQIFDVDLNSWPQTDIGYFCEIGAPVPYPVPFPQPGQTTSWQCELGGSATSCSASRNGEGGGGGGGEPATCEYLKIGTDRDNLRQVTKLEIEDNQTLYFECKGQGTISVIRVYEADSPAGTDKRVLAENIVNQASQDSVSGSYVTDLPDYVWCSINTIADLKFNDASPGCRVEVVRKGGGEGGGGGYCGDGVVQTSRGEQCDPSEVDENGEPTENAIWCSPDCKLIGDKAPLCAWVDPPSIMEDEYLFFWWKVDRNTIGDNIANGGCNQDNEGKWERRGLKCYFEIVDGNGHVVKSMEESCFNADLVGLPSSTLFKDFLSDYLQENSLFWVYKDGAAGAKLNGLNTYGEYKIRFKEIKGSKVCRKHVDGDGNEYYQWVSAETNWIPSNKYGRECLMNFVVTRPYMMQLGSFVSTTENEKFDDFKRIDGAPMLSYDEKNQIEVINLNAYDVNKIERAIGNLKNKYIFDSSNLYLGGATWQKARGAEIYYTSDDVDIEDINLQKPTTFIIDGNLKVKGDVQGSSMWLVNGTITFAPSNKDKLQQVEGIYIAKGSFKKVKIRNDNLNKEWAKRGDLEVRGILIGNGIAVIVENGRSILGDIWNSSNNIYELILKGASLKVITNPRLWLLPPPGILDLLGYVQKQSW